MNERNDTAVEAVLEHLIEHGPGDIAIQPEPRPEPEKEAAAAIFAFCNHISPGARLLIEDIARRQDVAWDRLVALADSAPRSVAVFVAAAAHGGRQGPPWPPPRLSRAR